MTEYGEESLEFTKAEIYEVLNQTEAEAIKLALAGKIEVDIKQLQKTAKTLRRGVKLTNEKSLSTMLILARKNIDKLCHRAMLKRNANAAPGNPGEINAQIASKMLKMLESMPGTKK